MKKVMQYSLILVSLAFVIFIAGIFWGRNTDFSLSSLESDRSKLETIPESAIIYSDEIYINGKMNINAAGKEDLCLLPGIGETIAERIIAYRVENGPYADIEDLLLVEGIGTAKLSKIEDYVTIGAAK